MSRDISARASTTFNRDTFKRGLDQWVDQAPTSGENRAEARTRILQCRQQGADFLSLSYLGLTSLPDVIGSLTRLRTLYLSFNQLTRIPDTIGSLTQLQDLNLNSNLLPEIPAAIGNLTQLQYLSLNRNQLTEIPAAIGNLTQLQYLSLIFNQLAQIPNTIGSLTQLQYLDLDGNHLTEIPAAIGSLTQLRTLDLRENRLTEIPAAIGSLTRLRTLYLDNNQLTTIPDSFFNPLRESNLRLYLDSNRISVNETQRLGALAQTGRVALNISIYEQPNQAIAQNQNITAEIIAAASEERRDALASFLEAPELSQFKIFLEECSRTQGWRDNRSEMTNKLSQLVNSMSQNDLLKTKCLALADTALGTCGDRVALGYVNMLLAQNTEVMPIAEMNPAQLFDYARQEAVIKFLNEKAELKVNSLRAGGGSIDEIETHLAYLKPAPRLGVDLPEISMLYRACSNVSEADLDSAVEEFDSHNINLLVADHIYEDPILRKHPAVNELIEDVVNEFDSSPQENEGDADYAERLDEMQGQILSLTLEGIMRFLERGNELDFSSSSASASASASSLALNPSSDFDSHSDDPATNSDSRSSLGSSADNISPLGDYEEIFDVDLFAPKDTSASSLALNPSSDFDSRSDDPATNSDSGSSSESLADNISPFRDDEEPFGVGPFEPEDTSAYVASRPADSNPNRTPSAQPTTRSFVGRTLNLFGGASCIGVDAIDPNARSDNGNRDGR